MTSHISKGLVSNHLAPGLKLAQRFCEGQSDNMDHVMHYI